MEIRVTSVASSANILSIETMEVSDIFPSGGKVLIEVVELFKWPLLDTTDRVKDRRVSLRVL